MAERFAKGIGENSNIVANNPRKFYDTTGQAILYISEVFAFSLNTFASL